VASRGSRCPPRSPGTTRRSHASRAGARSRSTTRRGAVPCVFPRHAQPVAAAEPVHALVVDEPTVERKAPAHHAVAVARMTLHDLLDAADQHRLVGRAAPTLRAPDLPLNVAHDRPPPPGACGFRRYSFADLMIEMSSLFSAPRRLSRAFSTSSCFSFSPPPTSCRRTVCASGGRSGRSRRGPVVPAPSSGPTTAWCQPREAC